MFVQTLMLLFETDEEEFVQLNVILEPTGNVLPFEGDESVGGDGADSARVKDQAGDGPYIPHEEVDVFDLACQ